MSFTEEKSLRARERTGLRTRKKLNLTAVQSVRSRMMRGET